MSNFQNTPSLQVAQNEGNRCEIEVYRLGRKCRHCKRSLSMYNPGPYCNLHADFGAKVKADRKEAVRQNNIRKTYEKRKGEKNG